MASRPSITWRTQSSSGSDLKFTGLLRYSFPSGSFGRFRVLLASRLRLSAVWKSSLALRALCFSCVGLPLTLLVATELVLQGNSLLLGGHSDSRLRSDFEAGFNGALELPGAPTARGLSQSPIPADREAIHAWLVLRHAPVVIQRVGRHPRWDIPVWIDLDGNEDPRDNVRNAERLARFEAGLYGEVTAETEDEHYLSYSVYHLRDYDHPIRALASAQAEHDNDHEGVMLRVSKQHLRVTEMMTWYHNRYFHCSRTPVSTGSERVMGKAHFEDETHPILYVQAMGHGVRCAQSIDLEDTRGLKIFRHRAGGEARRPKLDDSSEFDLHYEIDSFDRWYAQARGPFDEGNMFEGRIRLGFFPSGEAIEVGRFIAGAYSGEDSWARPKPAWSWDDAWDDVPIAAAHFFPSRTFRSHLGVETSTVYLEHRAVRLAFGISADALWRTLDTNVERREKKKWVKWKQSLFDSGRREVRRDHVYNAFWNVFKRYADRLFQGLG